MMTAHEFVDRFAERWSYLYSAADNNEPYSSLHRVLPIPSDWNRLHQSVSFRWSNPHAPRRGIVGSPRRVN